MTEIQWDMEAMRQTASILEGRADALRTKGASESGIATLVVTDITALAGRWRGPMADEITKHAEKISQAGSVSAETLDKLVAVYRSTADECDATEQQNGGFFV
ncbi:hypothetical protein [Mycobacteroides salmoniphilum]|nr:hypothetical protein [Mycobacteroides salmoniphilum]